ncbi:MAG TPA: RNA polymerase sigma factor [Thermoanaerobaculia bacterium]|nr:RNA polymerase sigma factor [Thermoanaerobaculia bacterium]
MTVTLSARETQAPSIPDDTFLLEELQRGNDTAFDVLVGRYHAAMVRMARLYVADDLAEEAAQEAWIAILKSCHRFEGRSSVRTWMFRIVINRAMSHAAHEKRGDRFLPWRAAKREMDDSSVDAPRFFPADHPDAGSWAVPPRIWTPEEHLLATEMLSEIERAITALPFLQRQVITLRDVEGWEARDVCDLYGISESNQRVLLHRGRARVRHALERLLGGEES